MIVDYNFYIENGNSKIPSAEFPLWETRGEYCLLGYVNSPLEEIDAPGLKPCVCHISDLLYENGKRLGISSENNDGYSVSYENSPIEMEILRIVKLYFGNTNYLYRGGIILE